MTTINKIAKKFFEAGINCKNPYEETKDMTDENGVFKKGILKAGREEGKRMLMEDLRNRGFSEKGCQQMLSDLGI